MVDERFDKYEKALDVKKALKFTLSTNMTDQEVAGHTRVACREAELTASQIRTMLIWAEVYFGRK